jgi:F-type H+-transporting ATPase subunit b
MGAIFTTFGIDWHLLVINAINFGLLLAGLTYFLYKPLGAMLETRRQKVAQGVSDAEEAGKRLGEIEQSKGEILAGAGKEADGIIAASRDTASAKAKEILSQADAAAARSVAQAQAQSSEMKAKAIEESKQEVARMIVLGIDKLAREAK